MKGFKKSKFLNHFSTYALLCTLVGMALPASSQSSDPYGGSSVEDDYDRLDGRGKSGVRVDVIEWVGNLEVHVYPGGSLAGLALHLDKRNKSKPVMVIGYRFKGNPKEQLIRRAILGIPLYEGFYSYQDRAVTEYDKIIITNNKLAHSTGLAHFKLDPPPSQLYPDGHPANNQKREIAGESDQKPHKSQIDDKDFQQKEGGIRPFAW